MKNKKKKTKKFIENKSLMIISSITILIILFAGAYFITSEVIENIKEKDTIYQDQTETKPAQESFLQESTEHITKEQSTQTETTIQAKTTVQAETTSKANVTQASTTYAFVVPDAKIIEYPSDTASWQLICLNRYRCVDSTVENKISLTYVAGSSERMDSRAAAAYEKMYEAASQDGIYLTPCSGYRSYSKQKTLYYEFVNDYLKDGYSESEAHDLASKRRNPPGSSEHNIGICMDIICAASSANFQNTDAYAWLDANAHNYGFILRYPEDKASITGVKFEPWHWRYVGSENAIAIKNSGLCLEEYLGLN